MRIIYTEIGNELLTDGVVHHYGKIIKATSFHTFTLRETYVTDTNDRSYELISVSSGKPEDYKLRDFVSILQFTTVYNNLHSTFDKATLVSNLTEKKIALKRSEELLRGLVEGNISKEEVLKHLTLPDTV